MGCVRQSPLVADLACVLLKRNVQTTEGNRAWCHLGGGIVMADLSPATMRQDRLGYTSLTATYVQ